MSAIPNFDHLAAPYRWMEYFTFGPLLMRTRLAFLEELKNSRRALVLGDGDGRFTRALLSANPALHVDAVDCSPSMLRALASRAAPFSRRLRTHCADLRHWQPEAQGYDLVITHFFLDCLNGDELAALVARILPALAPHARWVVSEFSIPPRPRMLAGLARLLVAALYFAFRILTGLGVRQLPDHSSAFQRAGFTRLGRINFLAGVLIAELWSAPGLA